MKTMLLPPMAVKRPRHQAFTESEGECVNLLNQRFNQPAPNLVWVGDITYIRVGGRFYYLCVVIDLFSRKVVSYRIGDRINSELTKATFLEAYGKRNPKELMFHSDRGSQYTAFSFRQLLDNLNVLQSFSKKGHPYDNAVAESFFKFLKEEETNRRNYHNLTELKLSVFKYIEGYYNSNRPHSSLGYLTPNEKEAGFPSPG